MSYQSLQFLQQDSTVPESIMFSRKLRIYPNKEQKELFRKCLGAYRYFYNKTNFYIKEQMSKGQKVQLTRPSIRPKVLKSDKDLKEEDPEKWQVEVPFDTRDEAMNDCIVAWKTCLSRAKEKQIKSFDIKYKSKKQPSQIFRVNKNALKVNDMTIFIRRLKNKAKIRMRKRDVKKYFQDNTLSGNFIVLRTNPDNWYLCLPRERKVPVYENAVYKSVFLDPGVRSFQTLYSPEGICGKINVDENIYKLAKKHDDLSSLSTKSTSKTKKHILNKMAKLRLQMKNVVNDLHWQTCSFLCKTFRTIVIPPFEVSKMVEGSPLGSKVTRSILTLSHGLFKERLLWYAKTKHRKVVISSEEYTTKTCGNCGNCQNIGSSKVYECQRCNCSIDRDFNGARNLAISTASRVMVHTL